MIKTNIYKIVGTAFLMVFLGAIGTGMWELFFSDVIQCIGNGLINLSDSIGNKIYRLVALNDKSYLLVTTGIFTNVTLAISPLFLVFFMYISINFIFNKILKEKSNKKNFYETLLFGKSDNIADNAKRVKLIIKVFFVPIFIILSLMYSLNLIQTIMVYTKVSEKSNQFEIIAPVISEQKLKEIKSEFRQIRSKRDFQILDDKINLIFKEFKLLQPTE